MVTIMMPTMTMISADILLNGDIQKSRAEKYRTGK